MTSDGAFNYEIAATEHREIEGRLEHANKRLTGIEILKQETAQVIQDLSVWRAEFGSSALNRLAAERDQIRAEVAHLDTLLAQLRAEESTLNTERNKLHSEIKNLHPQVVTLTQRQERLCSYIEEYEQREAAWLIERHEKINFLEQLSGQIDAQEREVARVHGEVDLRKDRVRILNAEQQARLAQQEGIRFYNSVAPSEAPPLDSAETRYKTALARYDQRFGRSELEGQIKQAGMDLAELRSEHHRLSSGLADEHVAVAALHPDLTGQQEDTERQYLKAHSGHESAVAALAKAERDRPDVPAHKQGLA